jgi:hypothetical protein
VGILLPRHNHTDFQAIDKMISSGKSNRKYRLFDIAPLDGSPPAAI